MPEAIKFGDIFKFREKEFVFLAMTGEVVYAGRILSREESKGVKDLYNKKTCNGAIRKFEDHVLFCFVILDTEDFRERMVHFGNTGKDDFGAFFDKIGSLGEKDKKEIKKEILRNHSAVDMRLKEIIANIDV